MSTSINLTGDLNDYLKKSGSTIGNGSSTSRAPSSAANGFLNTGWFSGTSDTGSTSSKTWFAYKPLSTKEDDKDSLVSGTSEDGPSKSSWMGNLFGPKEPEPKGWLPTLSRTQRLVGFVMCLFMGLICFSLSTMYIPVLLFKARKFAILFTFGSAFIVFAFALLLGPVAHLKHQFSRERLPFTSAYFTSLLATLYFALQVQSTLLTTIFALIQIIALLWYVLTYIPGGQTGLVFFSKMAASTVSKTLPV